MRIIHRPVNKRIDFLDERFYTVDGVNFYPSVTTVLEALPKGAQYMQWVKDLGHSADEVMNRAAAAGTKVHTAIENYLSGDEVQWTDVNGNANYSVEEWGMVLKFVEFWEGAKPELIAVECNLISENLRLGGTLDILCKINGERWLIDNKTSAAIYDSHALQIAAYGKMWDEINPEHKHDRRGIMHLKAQTRGEDKKGKCIQGRGWKLHEFDESLDSLWSDFQHLRAIWDRCNPDYKPRNLTMPDRVKLIEPLKQVA